MAAVGNSIAQSASLTVDEIATRCKGFGQSPNSPRCAPDLSLPVRTALETAASIGDVPAI